MDSLERRTFWNESSGLAAGFFSASNVRLVSRACGETIRREADRLTRLGWRVESASLSSCVGNYAVLARARDGSHVVFTSGSKHGIVVGRPDSDVSEAQAIIVGPKDWPLKVISIKSARPLSLGTVVYFGGGPAKSVDLDEPPFFVRQLASSGFDIILVQYSGSAGVGNVADRLRVKGFDAFVKDSQVLADSALIKKAKGLYIIGESFGGIPAVEFARAASRRAKKLLLLAPLLKHRDPIDWGDVIGPFAINVDYQQKFEIATMGNDLLTPNGIPEFLMSRLSILVGKQVHVYGIFGSSDQVSRPEDLNDLCKWIVCFSVPAEHQLVSAVPETWDYVRQMFNITRERVDRTNLPSD